MELWRLWVLRGPNGWATCPVIEAGVDLLLGQGARQRRTLAAETDDISALARSISTDKHLTKQLLRAAGVPVPEGRPVADAEDA